MEYTVNENCISCGLCATLCPEVFELGDDIAEAKAEPQGEDEEARAEEALESCPTSAIEHK